MACTQKIGRAVKGRQTYTIAELLEFQPLYQMMPEDFTWADTLGADAVVSNKKKNKAKQKDKKGRANGGMLSYDASLALYFNPTEYAAAIGLYTGPPADAAAVNGGDPAAGGAGSASSPVSPVEEAIIAKRRFAPYVLFGVWHPLALSWRTDCVLCADCWTMSDPRRSIRSSRRSWRSQSRARTRYKSS